MRRPGGALLLLLLAAFGLALLAAPARLDSQGVEVFLNVTQGGSKKLGIAIPEFTRLTSAPDEGNFARGVPEIIGNDLRFSALFAVANTPALPTAADAIKQEFGRLQQAGAHAAMHGLMRVDGQRLTIEFRLYDLTNPEFRLIASKMFWVEPLADHRRLAHRIADEVVHQFTGERGIAETKIAYVSHAGPNKELVMIDYDGFNQAPLTNLRSTSLSPAWSPTDSSVAFTSFFKGYPYLFRIFPFNARRRGQEPELMSAWPGINTSPAWAPDGRVLALTLSKGGNPDIYALRVGTSDFRQLTNSRGIETDPSWSPTGREIAFTSDRSGSPQIWVMSAEGTNARRLSFGGLVRHPAAVVAPRRHHRLHPPDVRRVRSLGHQPRRFERPRPDPGQRQQRGGLLGTQRSPRRVLVLPRRRPDPALHDVGRRHRAAASHPRPG